MYSELDWLPGGRLNIAHEAIDRHANGTLRDKLAMIWESTNGQRETYTFHQLKTLTDKFANVLKSLGITKGDRVFLFLDRVPELYIGFYASLKVGALAAIISPNISTELFKDRMRLTGAKVLVTHPHLRFNITGIIPELFELQHIVTVNRGQEGLFLTDTTDLTFEEELEKAPPDFEIVPTNQYDPFMIEYTSRLREGSKGVVHRHQAAVQFLVTGKWVMDLHKEDLYWSVMEPASSMGAAYTIVAPWINGTTQFVYMGEVTDKDYFEQLKRHRITVWHVTPEVIKRMIAARHELPAVYDLDKLRLVISAGAALTSKEVIIAKENLGFVVHDSWGQAETGVALCANFPSMDIRPGSMGRPVPGIKLAILNENLDVNPPEMDGTLAVRPDWASLPSTYWKDENAFNDLFRRGWYISGDRAKMDSNGHFWYRGRMEDT